MIFSALVMALLFGACSDSDVNPGSQIPEGDNKSIYLQFSTNKQRTRAVEETATGTAAPLLSAIIYFMDSAADPLVYAVRTVGPTGADATVAQLEAGVEFNGIPTQVTQVYVVGNYNSADQDGDAAAFPVYEGTTWSAIRSVILNIQQVAYPALSDGTTNGVLLSVMDGLADVLDYDTNSAIWQGTNTPPAGSLFAEVPIEPLNARLEIEEISYSGTLLASFTIEGIYINNFFEELPVALAIGTNEPLNNGSNVALYDRGDAAFAYDYYTTLEDEIGSALTVTGGAASLTAGGANGVWAYHVFGNSTPVPHIILKLTNVLAQDGTALGNRYVTVTGFTTTGGAAITTFERNVIYKITDLAFTDGDISIIPEPEEVSIWVHVEVEPWETVEVLPVI